MSVESVIKALLSEEGKTEAEISAARAKAAKLMAKHGVSEAEIMMDNPDLVEAAVSVSRYEWLVAQNIATSLGRLTDTVPHFRNEMGLGLTGRSDRKRIAFSGYRPDAEYAEAILRGVLAQAKVGARPHKKSTAKTVYLRSFGIAVCGRLARLHRSVKAERTDSANALVPVKMDRIKDFVGELGEDRSRAPKAHDIIAEMAGYRDGKNATLQQELDKNVLKIGKD